MTNEEKKLKKLEIKLRTFMAMVLQVVLPFFVGMSIVTNQHWGITAIFSVLNLVMILALTLSFHEFLQTSLRKEVYDSKRKS